LAHIHYLYEPIRNPVLSPVRSRLAHDHPLFRGVGHKETV